jgi:tRNA(adenine34) deaminase
MTTLPKCAHCSIFPRSRRSLLATLAAAATALVVPLHHPTVASPGSPDDETFMRIAIEEARQADFPYGAVIVRDGDILARGRNRGRQLDDPTAHGEIDAIRRALAQHGSKALQGATLYTSGEPCAMCMGAILWCYFDRLVYAASIDQIATRTSQMMVHSADVAAKAPFAPISITGGVLADEAMALFAR